MSKRPEHVRCENCCYWEGFAHGKLGFCLRYPQTVILAQVYSKEDVEKACHALPGSDARGVPIASGAEDFCGEFREEWPEEDATRLLEKWAEGIVRRDD